MGYTTEDLPLSFRGNASGSSQRDNAVSALADLLSSVNADGFTVKGEVVAPHDGTGLALTRDEALAQVARMIEAAGNSIISTQAAASELYPEVHRDEIVKVQLDDYDGKGRPVFRWAVEIEYAG